MINKNDTILFIGLGGAGQRHLRILRNLLPENKFIALRKRNLSPLLNPNFTVDTLNTIEEKYNIESIYEENELKNQHPKITIISTPTIFHTKYCLLAKELGSNVFVEKPGFSTKSDLILLEKNFKNHNLSLKIGFQRAYHPMIRKVFEEIKKDNISNYNCHLKLSSFVPDWHPYEDFRNLYACREDLGGGVILTECHELDIINGIFGLPLKVEKNLFKEKKYRLKIYDSAELRVKYPDCSMFADISFLRKPNERTILIENKNENIKYLLDLNNNKLCINKNKNEFKFSYNFDSDYLFELQAKDIISLKNNNYNELKRLRSLSEFL
tara:strand:- start:2384 stop:3358 length:975 start_codon:yes stop_codon:yes gene_type:complete